MHHGAAEHGDGGPKHASDGGKTGLGRLLDLRASILRDLVASVLELPADWLPQGMITLGFPAQARERGREPWETRVVVALTQEYRRLDRRRRRRQVGQRLARDRSAGAAYLHRQHRRRLPGTWV